MESKKYWERNQDLKGSRCHLLFLWSMYCKSFENEEIERSNSLIQTIESLMPFKDKEEHEHWLDVGATFKFWEDFEELTLRIIKRRTQKELDDLIIALEKVAKDLCVDSSFYEVFNAFYKTSNGWVLPISQWKEWWNELCQDEWQLQCFLEGYKEQYDKVLCSQDLYKTFYGFETSPSCQFYKGSEGEKSDLIECIFERYAMGLDDDECVAFFKALIKELL